MTEEYQLEVYQRANGTFPFVEWESELSEKERAIVSTRLARLRQGNFRILIIRWYFMKKSKPHKNFLFERLKNPKEAAAYLNAALQDEDPGIFLIALRDIAQANGGMAHVAQEAHLNRETLYRTLSKKGNPTLTNLLGLLGTCRLQLNVQPALQS